MYKSDDGTASPHPVDESMYYERGSRAHAQTDGANGGERAVSSMTEPVPAGHRHHNESSRKQDGVISGDGNLLKISEDSSYEGGPSIEGQKHTVSIDDAQHR